MIDDELALHGGPRAVPETPKRYPSMGRAEVEAAAKVVQANALSGFYGSWGDEYFGGPKVLEFEAAWAKRFRTPHAVSVNSATSGLVAAMGAIGIGPGDEVIVPPTTMSASAIAPLPYGGIPVFADIEPETFCLDPAEVRAAITPRTKAILAVNLFGHPAALRELRELADAKGLALVEDAAQAPLAEEHGRLAGTVGDIGVFSLNYHKHLHTGEGGMCVTADPALARRMQLIRNHGENVVEHFGMQDVPNLIGFNLRLTEVQAAIGLEQLKAADRHLATREAIAERLTKETRDLEGLTPPRVRAGCRHVYYQWPLRVDEAALGLSRAVFSQALAAEGFPHEVGYVRPLYLLPLFRNKRGIGAEGWPFSLTNRTYGPGLCPVAERLHERELLCFETCAWDLDEAHLAALVGAVHKVHRHRRRLAARA